MMFVKKIFSFKISLIIIWFTFFFSINLNPAEFLSYNLINQIRLILPLFICILLFAANLKKFKFNYHKVFPIYFYTIFFSYIFFTLLNQENSNINIFWPLYMFLSFLFIHKFNSLEDRIMLTKFSIIIIISITILFLFTTFFDMYDRKYYHFYGLVRETLIYAGNESPPKPTGLSRLSLICFIFFLLNYFLNKRFKNYYLLFLILFFALSALLFQSRTNNFIFVFINLFLCIFYFKKYFFDRRLIIFSFIFPILMNMTYTHIIAGKYIGESNDVFVTFKNSIIRDQPIWDQNMTQKQKIHRFSSGRFTDWENAFNLIKKNPIKGYGAQSDRLILKQSIHNSFLYSTLSGGIIASISLILLYLYSIKILINFYFNRKNFYKHDNILHFCAVILIVIFLRSIFETSFSVFSIDYLLYIILFLTLEKAFSAKN